MQLISCHIENFGKLSNFDISFTDGLNEVMQDNGWGKTTLSTFIKVMLYGFDNESKRDKNEREREKYRPWQSGEYGGKLTFRTADKVYTICRSFGNDTRSDRFELLDEETGQETGCYGINIGQELLHIDKDTFFNTLYILQNDRSTKVTDDIHARMGTQDDIVGDISGYSAVGERIKKLLDENKPTGKRGSISKLKTEISELEQKQEKREALDKSTEEQQRNLEIERAKREELNVEKKHLQEERSKVTAYETKLAKKKRYKELLEENNMRVGELQKAEKAFPGKRPTKEQCAALQSGANEFLRLSESEKNKRLSDEEEARLSALTARFVTGVPEERQISGLLEKNAVLQQKNIDLIKLRPTEDEQAGLKELEQVFNEDVTEEQITSQIENVRAINGLKGEIQQKKLMLDTLGLAEEQQEKDNEEDNGQDTNSLGLYWRLPVGIILLAVGILVALALNAYIGIIVSLTGVVLLIGCAVLYRGINASKTDEEDYEDEEEEPSRIDELRKEISESEERIGEITCSVHAFLASLNSDCADAEMESRLYDLKSRLDQYKKIHAKAVNFEESDIQGQTEKLKQDICTYLRKYIPEQQNQPELFESALRSLEREASLYSSLSKRKQDWAEAKDIMEASKKKLTDAMNEFSLTVDSDINVQLRSLNNDVLVYEACKVEAQKSREKLEAFASQENVEELINLVSPITTKTADELDMAVNDVEKQVSVIENNIRAYNAILEENASKIEELNEKLAVLEEKKEKCEKASKKYETLKYTQEYLEKAKNALTNRYTEPFSQALAKNYEILSNGEESHYSVDVKMNVSVDTGTVPKDLSTLSRGYLDLSWMCMRIAYIDAMYPDEKPFIVMDDPFVNMDEKKIEGGKKLLNELAKDYQIIYFTCHESRKMER